MMPTANQATGREAILTDARRRLEELRRVFRALLWPDRSIPEVRDEILLIQSEIRVAEGALR